MHLKSCPLHSRAAVCFSVLIIAVRKRRRGKVMFSQACVKNSVHGEGGTCMSGVCGEGVHGGRAMHGRGACMTGDAWQEVVHGRGVHGRGWHVWQWACMAGETATVADSTHPTGMHSFCSMKFIC